MNSDKPLIRTLRLRLKDKHASALRQQAQAVNTVWNYCNELCVKHWQRTRTFFSAYDIHPYTKGAGKELGLHSQTVQAIAEEYCTRRKQFKKVKLRWRVSRGARRSLGWIPFKASAIRYKNGQVWFAGQPLSLWDSYGLSAYELGSGSISEDARGRWYLNVTVKAPRQPLNAQSASNAETAPRQDIGIDLGQESLLVTSKGYKVEAPRFYRDLAPKLAIAQRAGKTARVRAIHAKIANRRKDHAHKLTTNLVRQHRHIFVGNVSAKALGKTRMATSVYDAGWSQLRTLLQYKCDDAKVGFLMVNEAYSTQTCSCCGKVSDNSPKGRAGLGIREWSCGHCGAVHDRDVNAARNILALGRERLAGGNPGLS